MDNDFLIYKVTSPSNKIYIGFTSKSLEERKKAHFYESFNENSKSYETSFKRAIRKYGGELIWEKIDNSQSLEEALHKEAKYIKLYNSMQNGYNDNLGGIGRHYSLVEDSEIIAEAQNYFDIKTYCREAKYIHISRNRGIYKECTKHMVKTKKGNVVTDKTILESIIGYVVFEEWISKNKKYYFIARKRKYLRDIIKNRFKELQKERILSLAKNCSSLNEFYKKHRNEVYQAKRIGKEFYLEIKMMFSSY